MDTVYKKLMHHVVEKRGLKQADLARIVGVTAQNITHWKNRGIPGDKYVPLAKAFGISLDWLLLDVGSDPEVLLAAQHEHQPKCVSVPILDWTQVLDWRGRYKASSVFDRESVKTHISVAGMFGPNVLALPVTGESMEPVFYEGEMIVVDADRTPCSEDYVVVTGKPAAKPALRQLLVGLDGVREMKPANRRYRTVAATGDTTIIGVVVMKVRSY